MNKQFQRGTVGGNENGAPRRGITGATYSRENLRKQQQAAQERSTQQPQRDSQPQNRNSEPVRRNKYGAKCAKCGGWVPQETGLLLGSKQAGWRVEHVQPCPIDQVVGEAVEQEQVEDAHPGRNVVAGEVLYDGVYTMQHAPSGGHRTLKLKTQAEDKDFMPGVQLIAYLSGADNDTDYTTFGHIKNGRLSVWKKHQAKSDLVADAQAFMANPHDEDEVLASINCFACGRTLTVPASVHAGLGPECAKRR